MKQDRFLTGILIGIVVLIVAALAVFFLRQNTKQAYLPELTPDAVVHNYVLALLNRDYPKAYGYLADLDNKPSLDQFRQAFAVGRLTPSSAGVKVGAATITGQDATVEVSLLYTPNDPFSSGYNNVGSANLVQQNGAWKISSMPAYTLWDYSWFQKP